MEAALLITRIVGVVFVITSMVSAGLAIRASDVAANARNLRLVGAAIAAGFVAPRLIVLGLTAALPIRSDSATGLTLLAGAAGAPLLPKVAVWIGASVALAVTVMMLLVMGTALSLSLPLAMPRLLPGTDINPWRIARPLSVVIVAPLAAGSSFSDRHGVAVMIVVADLVAVAALLVAARPFGRSGAGGSVSTLRETARG